MCGGDVQGECCCRAMWNQWLSTCALFSLRLRRSSLLPTLPCIRLHQLDTSHTRQLAVAQR